jgi:putative oxidoreductase
MFDTAAPADTSRARAVAGSLARSLPAVAIGILFIFIGYGKFANRGVWVTIFEQIGLGQWFRIFTGVVQVTGGVLMIPRRTRTAGAVLLGCTMFGAAVVDVVVIGSPVAIVPLLLLIIIAAVWVTSPR